MVTTTNIPASSSQHQHSAAAVRQMKEELLKKVELLSSHLPANTLDQLIDDLGGPECVAEVSYPQPIHKLPLTTFTYQNTLEYICVFYLVWLCY